MQRQRHEDQGAHEVRVEKMRVSIWYESGFSNSFSFLKRILQENYKNILSFLTHRRNFTGEDAEDRKWVPIIAFECRGLEPINW